MVKDMKSTSTFIKRFDRNFEPKNTKYKKLVVCPILVCEERECKDRRWICQKKFFLGNKAYRNVSNVIEDYKQKGLRFLNKLH